jgi:Cu+-exporting ATPase
VKKEVWDTALQKIIEMVEDAQTKKAPIEHLADKVSWIFVPIVIIISILTFLWWYFIVWAWFDKSLLVMVSVLVIACPCALWLATPTAIMVATWKWANAWILLKTPEVLEKSWKIDVVVFDKTWTLTEWKPKVNKVLTFEWTEKELFKIANSLALNSNHPLSKAVSLFENEKYQISNFKEISWKWLVWEIKWEEIILGNQKLLSEKWYKISTKFELSPENTPLYVWKNGNVIWIIWLLDLPKKTSKDTVLSLKKKGVEVFMITWDNKTTAKAIWNMIWIDNIIAEVLPENKKSEVEKIQKKWKVVAFVWDWINDSPALAQSDLWIWMLSWSDVAIETAWIVVVNSQPQKVVEAINLSKWTYSVIKQNLFWAFFYNTIMIPIAFMWLLLPMFAALAMSLSSVSVVLNSLRIKIKNLN